MKLMNISSIYYRECLLKECLTINEICGICSNHHLENTENNGLVQVNND